MLASEILKAPLDGIAGLIFALCVVVAVFYVGTMVIEWLMGDR